MFVGGLLQMVLPNIAGLKAGDKANTLIDAYQNKANGRRTQHNHPQLQHEPDTQQEYQTGDAGEEVFV